MAFTNVSGHWAGSYRQHGSTFPIRAEFVQQGDRLAGSMIDAQPDDELSLFEAMGAAGLPPGADEQIAARVRAMVPESPREPIRYVSHLPSASVLEGHLRGQAVQFVKTYQGRAFGGFRIGQTLVGVENEGHSVHYDGEVSHDGQQIEGRWWIEANPSLSRVRMEGEFTLNRQPETPASGEPPAPASEPPRRRPWWQFWRS